MIPNLNPAALNNGLNAQLPEVVSGNCMHRIIVWLRDSHNSNASKLMKFFCVATSVAVIFGVCVKIQGMLLASMVIAGLAFWAKHHWTRIVNRENQIWQNLQIEEERIEEARIQLLHRQRKENTLTNVKNIFGGEAAWDALPIINIGNQRGARDGYIDFLRLEDLPHPIMRGIDPFNRPFLCLKLRKLDPGATNYPRVSTFVLNEVGGWNCVRRLPDGQCLYNIVDDGVVVRIIQKTREENGEIRLF